MADISAHEREMAEEKGQAMPGGRFPIRNREDLENAIRAVGRASGGEEGRRRVRRFIMIRAGVLKLTELIPDTWNRDGSLKA